jgi:hypothetical protein
MSDAVVASNKERMEVLFLLLEELSVTLLSRFVPRAGLVTSRQIFVCRGHGGWLRNDLAQRGRDHVPDFHGLATEGFTAG